MSAPAQVFHIHAALRTTRGQGVSTLQHMPIKFNDIFNTPVPINVYCLTVSVTVFRSQGTGSNDSSRDSTVI